MKANRISPYSILCKLQLSNITTEDNLCILIRRKERGLTKPFHIELFIEKLHNLKRCAKKLDKQEWAHMALPVILLPLRHLGTGTGMISEYM